MYLLDPMLNRSSCYASMAEHKILRRLSPPPQSSRTEWRKQTRTHFHTNEEVERLMRKAWADKSWDPRQVLYDGASCTYPIVDTPKNRKCFTQAIYNVTRGPLSDHPLQPKEKMASPTNQQRLHKTDELGNVLNERRHPNGKTYLRDRNGNNIDADFGPRLNHHACFRIIDEDEHPFLEDLKPDHHTGRVFFVVRMPDYDEAEAEAILLKHKQTKRNKMVWDTSEGAYVKRGTFFVEAEVGDVYHIHYSNKARWANRLAAFKRTRKLQQQPYGEFVIRPYVPPVDPEPRLEYSYWIDNEALGDFFLNKGLHLHEVDPNVLLVIECKQKAGKLPRGRPRTTQKQRAARAPTAKQIAEATDKAQRGRSNRSWPWKTDLLNPSDTATVLVENAKSARDARNSAHLYARANSFSVSTKSRPVNPNSKWPSNLVVTRL